MESQPLAPALILENTYQAALEVLDDSIWSLSPPQLLWLQTVTSSPENRKGVLTVLITSLLKKVITPAQDIRQHQENLPGGYSGRTLDTKWVTPFLRSKGFPHMAESGWLTRSLEQNHAYTKDYPGKVSPAALKMAFLDILDDVQNNPEAASIYLTYIFSKLQQFHHRQKSQTVVRLPQPITTLLTVGVVTGYVHQHFATKYPQNVSGAARLPVLALYAAYQCLMLEVERYKDKQLYPLESHTAADVKSGKLGDIEVARSTINKQLTTFEAVEVKFGRPITFDIVETAYEKIRLSSVERYYILSTADVKVEDRDKIEDFVQRVRSEHGCEMIINGVEQTLKYYLRLLTNIEQFLDNYAVLLETDEVVKTIHRQRWNEILQQSL